MGDGVVVAGDPASSPPRFSKQCCNLTKICRFG